MKWRGEALENLMRLDVAELLILYPDQNEKNLKRRKQEYAKKWREYMERLPESESSKPTLSEFERLLKRSNIDPANVAKVNRMNIYQSAKKGEDGEWDVQDLYSMQITPVESGESFQPIEPAKITPTRRRVAERAFKLILVYGDGQVDYRRVINPVTDESELIPIHDIPAHNVIKQINARYQPETTVNLGDFADMAALSRFDPKSDHFHKTLGPSLRYIHDFYAQMRSDNPKAEHVEVDSNHAARPKRQVLANLPAMYDFVRPGEDYPMLSYYYMANLGKVGLRFISGYGAAEYIYGQESGNPIIFKHGNHSSSSPGATVRKESQQNPTKNVIRGHGHKDEEIRTTIELPSGERRQLFYKQLGATCLNNGMVEGYDSAVDDFNRPVTKTLNHQTTIAMVEDYGGRYNLNTIEIIDGVAFYKGEEFNGNE